MLWFNHPKQIGSRKPVAMLVQKKSARAVTLGMPIPAIDMPALHEGAALPIAEPLNFAVRYALPEYVSFMWQHCGYLIRRRRIGFLASYWMQCKSTAAASLHFVLQGRASRIYEFTIDAHGIVRSSGTGVTLIPWSDVSAIRRYARGYLMVLKRGTLPIPYRCLGSAQASAMDGFAATLRSAPRR